MAPATSGPHSRDPSPRPPRARHWEVELSDEVAAWYARLSARDRAYADRAFDRLEANGPALGMPHGRGLGGGLHELRFACEGVPRRITYAIGPGREVRALTTFRKQRTHERHEIERARGAEARTRTPERAKERSRAW